MRVGGVYGRGPGLVGTGELRGFISSPVSLSSRLREERRDSV